jgi:glycosyltransferase involved in cell wall biosynthesis
LLEAFGNLYQTDPSYRLLLVGHGPLRSELEEQVRAQGWQGGVTFAGAVEHNQMPGYIAAMDVTVAPYPALEEFYYSPLKLFEYMAMGRPVVAARIGQVADIVTDGMNGLLFEPGDSQGLARCIRRLKEDPPLREELGRKAGAAGTIQTWNTSAARLIQWVEPLVVRRPPVTMPPGVAEEAGPVLKQG